VAYDQTSSIIYVPLLANTADGQPLNYSTLSDPRRRCATRYQNDRIDIHITGFAKKVGDLIDGLKQILLFFAVAIVITTAVLFWYTRCLRSTAGGVLLPGGGGLATRLAAIAGLSTGPVLGAGAVLVFAIGMSHGAQKMNGIMQDIGRGMHRVVAALHVPPLVPGRAHGAAV
jgi:predicted RND superfamily exporter protein